MKNRPRKSPGPARAGTDGNEIVARWDGMNLMERLELIMDHASLLLARGLIAPSEIALVEAMPESAREYIVYREDQPMFTSINLKKEIDAQLNRDKLEAALEAVFK